MNGPMYSDPSRFRTVTVVVQRSFSGSEATYVKVYETSQAGKRPENHSVSPAFMPASQHSDLSGFAFSVAPDTRVIPST